MGKIRSALTLLASGSFRQFCLRLRMHLRRRKLNRHGNSPFVYRLAYFPFVCIPSMEDSVDTYLTGETDTTELGLLREWLRPTDTFIDIGANYGLYLAAAGACTRGRAAGLAIEASPLLAGHIRTTLALLGLNSTHIEQKAVGDSDTEVRFYLAPPGKSTGEQSLHPDPARAADYTPHSIRQETLTTIISRHPAFARPALIKMDIEGAEVAALRGAPPAWFAADGPLWLVELNPTALARAGTDCAVLAACFPAHAFDRWLSPQFSKHDGRHLPLRRLTENETFTDCWFYNLIAVPRAVPRTLPTLVRLAP